jgi:hypothetical protein
MGVKYMKTRWRGCSPGEDKDKDPAFAKSVMWWYTSEIGLGRPVR